MENKNEFTKWHGFKGKKSWPLPSLVAKSEEAARSDQGNMIKANEYMDTDDVLKKKLQIVAELLKKSSRTVAYTGAGLSKSSGIPDYATKAKESVVTSPKLKSNLDALPTYAHCALTALERAGYIHHYVQQNHDGLPQKSGFPQEKINEIHGAWFDPSNPVVKFGGNLRDDLFDWMAEEEKKVDLCLCLGTSLSGMNADRMANTPAKKSLKDKALGTVVINLQQTKLDSKTVIRIWAKLDDCFKFLSEIFSLGEIIPIPIKIPKGDIFEVPYNNKGKLDPTTRTVLDLQDNSSVVICVEYAMNFGAIGKVVGKREGHYSILLQEEKGTYKRLFGIWWIDAALRGAVPCLPLVNQDVFFGISDSKIPENSDFIIPDHIRIIQSHYTLLDRESGDNKHQWELRLAPPADKFVEEVIWYLHPTFRNPEVQCTVFPFKISRKGWGTFDVKVKIKLRNKDSKQIIVHGSHLLSFSGEGDEVSATEIIIDNK